MKFIRFIYWRHWCYWSYQSRNFPEFPFDEILLGYEMPLYLKPTGMAGYTLHVLLLCVLYTYVAT